MCSLMEHSDRSYREQMAARASMAAFQDALGDYYDSGAIGDAPKLADFRSTPIYTELARERGVL